MLTSGSPAPQFELPGTRGEEIALYDSAELLGSEPTVVVFYPFDFHPPSTRALNRLADREWLGGESGIDVVGVSADSAYAHQTYIGKYDFPFPLVSDGRGSVAAAFGVQSDEWSNHEDVPRRSVFAVDGEGTVRYGASPDSALASLDVEGLQSAVAAMDGASEARETGGGGLSGGGD